jgi:recombination protein U
MKMKSGKRFEKNFQESIPEKIFHYRLRDNTSSWGGNDQVRFQVPNICDYILFHNGTLCLLELKSHKGKSLPFNCIRENQEKELIKATEKGVIGGILVEFSDVNRVFWLDIQSFVEYKKIIDRKSVPISYF